MMPFITEMPNRPMKPMAAEMLRGVWVRTRAKMPPTMAMGRTLAASRVSTIEAKLMNSNRPMRPRLIGTTTSSRPSASCSAPSSPTHSVWYPPGRATSRATLCCASSTAPPRSRPRTLNLMGM